MTLNIKQYWYLWLIIIVIILIFTGSSSVSWEEWWTYDGISGNYNIFWFIIVHLFSNLEFCWISIHIIISWVNCWTKSILCRTIILGLDQSRLEFVQQWQAPISYQRRSQNDSLWSWFKRDFSRWYQGKLDQSNNEDQWYQFLMA